MDMNRTTATTPTILHISETTEIKAVSTTLRVFGHTGDKTIRTSTQLHIFGHNGGKSNYVQ